MPEPKTTVQTAGWYGRDGPTGRIYCSRNGWWEATWRRDPDVGWIVDSATIRPVIGFDWSAGRMEPILGEPHHV